MKRIQTTASKPGAWIVSNLDRGRKSIKNGKVYLEDKSEFLIELHNPLTSCVLCDIKLNGQSISKTGLVLKPGQRFYLDCFPDDKKKFIFQTYEVENTQESKESIAKNGLLEVYFYKEEVVSINNWRPKFEKIIERHYYPTYPPYYYPWGLYGGCSTVTIGGSLTTGTLMNSGGTLNVGGGLNSGGTLNISNYSSGSTLVGSSTNTSYCNNIKLDQQLNDPDFNPVFGNVYSDTIETGRIEKGSSSSQQFTEIDMEFQSMCICSIILQILPESKRPIETKDIIQPKHKEIIDNIMNPKSNGQNNFCENCGNKLKGSENFCPSCGKKLK